eukprot:TRINITY_DN9918_c0_g1_i1.p1 TRINITY_DN9918_c0_g1~~TRINITY_DN9918_c0_g1_i1.p1  ORF type:complete len:278 (-),score=56.87 TRINITY_DN9918_c0_g1_i1:136-969(-)
MCIRDSYNLIKKEPEPKVKPPLYHSKFDPLIPPTGSTLGLKTTPVPGVYNLSGSMVLDSSVRLRAEASTFGRPKDSFVETSPKPKTKKSLSPGSRMRASLSPTTIKSMKMRDSIKPPVPKRDEVPIMGLRSSKDFILSNAVDVILASPVKKQDKDVDWLKRDDYGKVPTYLTQVKEHLKEEYEQVRRQQLEEQEQRQSQIRKLTDEEVEELRRSLQAKLEDVTRKYQRRSYLTTFDTLSMLKRKEEYEKEIAFLEKEIEKLNKRYIFVDMRSSANIH